MTVPDRREPGGLIHRRQSPDGSWEPWHVLLDDIDSDLYRRFKHGAVLHYAETLGGARRELAAMVEGYDKPLRVVFSESSTEVITATARWYDGGQEGPRPHGPLWVEWLCPDGAWRTTGAVDAKTA